MRENEGSYGRHSPETAQENAFQIAVADKVRRAITSALNARLEQFVEDHVHRDNIEEATNSLFSLISNGAKEEDIEKELSNLSSKIAKETIERT